MDKIEVKMLVRAGGQPKEAWLMNPQNNLETNQLRNTGLEDHILCFLPLYYIKNKK